MSGSLELDQHSPEHQHHQQQQSKQPQPPHSLPTPPSNHHDSTSVPTLIMHPSHDSSAEDDSDDQYEEVTESNGTATTTNGNGFNHHHSSPLPTLATPISPSKATLIAESLPISSLPSPSPPHSLPQLDTLPTLPPSPPSLSLPTPQAIPPPPAFPLPSHLDIPSHPIRADSSSSLAVQPPTPSPAALLPPTATSRTEEEEEESETEAAQVQSQLAAYMAQQEDQEEAERDRIDTLEDIKMSGLMDEDAEVSSSSLKRSAPDEETSLNGVSTASIVKAEEDERESKRQKFDPSEPVIGAFASPTKYLAPTPEATGYDPSAFSIDTSAPAVSASTSALPTISPSDLLHQSSPFGSPPAPPIASSSTSLPLPSPQPQAYAAGPIPVLSKAQLKHLQALVRTLKKHRSAPPFLRPVDPIALLIPDYLKVITRPMDLGTVESKLNQTGKAMSAASKVGRTFGLDYSGNGIWEGIGEGVYRTAKEAREDVELVWENCFRYNGPKEKNPVSAMAGQLQEVAEKALKTLPVAPALEYKPEPPRLPTPEVVKKERRQSNTFVPTIRRSEDGPRPKREIHAPARELPYEEPTRQKAVSNKFAVEQLRFCKETIRELFRKTHEAYAFPFYSPVDYITLNIPQYPQLIKRPMDLGTIRNKLESNQYPTPPYGPFENDVRLVFKNCYAFNPPGSVVHDWGKKLERVFEDKWATRPMEVEEEEEDFSEDENLLAIEKQVQELQQTLVMLRAKKLAKEQRRAAERASRPPKASTSTASKKGSSNEVARNRAAMSASVSHRKKSGGGGGGGGHGGGGGGGGSGAGGKKKKSAGKKLQHSDEEEDFEPVEETVTFEMKRDLAVKIVSFEGDNLERAIDIIRTGRPDLLGDANKEIELDIDQLDQRTLLALYRFVCPAPAVVRRGPSKGGNRRAGGGGGGGGGAGSKRKNLDESKETERIEMLEARLAQFDNSGSTPSAAGVQADQASSDSSSDDGSDSDSEDDD